MAMMSREHIPGVQNHQESSTETRKVSGKAQGSSAARKQSCTSFPDRDLHAALETSSGYGMSKHTQKNLPRKWLCNMLILLANTLILAANKNLPVLAQESSLHNIQE